MQWSVCITSRASTLLCAGEYDDNEGEHRGATDAYLAMGQWNEFDQWQCDSEQENVVPMSKALLVQEREVFGSKILKGGKFKRPLVVKQWMPGVCSAVPECRPNMSCMSKP